MRVLGQENLRALLNQGSQDGALDHSIRALGRSEEIPINAVADDNIFEASAHSTRSDSDTLTPEEISSNSSESSNSRELSTEHEEGESHLTYWGTFSPLHALGDLFPPM